MRCRVRLSIGWAILLLAAASLGTAADAFAQESSVSEGSMAPVNTAAPTISGEAEVGDVLTATPGSWTLNPSFQFQWERCGGWGAGLPSDGLACTAIAGASAVTYTVVRSDEGTQLRVRVTASSDGVAGTPAESAPTERVGAGLIPAMTAAGALTPDRLPNRSQAPTVLRIGFTSGASNSLVAPPLRSISFDLSRDLSLHTAGLRSCSYNALYSPSPLARERCAAARVGHGEVESELQVKGDYQYTPVKGRLTAYYASASTPESARILARVQIRRPSPIVYVLPFRIEREKGRFATRLVVPEMRHIHGIILPGYTFPYGYERISSLSLVLGRSFTFHGARKSFVTASCPARRGGVKADYPLARAHLAYSGANANSDPDGDGTLSRPIVTRCSS